MALHGSPRVVARAPTASDRDAFMTAMRTSRPLHRPFLTLPSTLDAFDAMLERARRESYLPMLARRREDDVIVGYFAIGNIVRGSFQSAYLGYRGVAGYTGRGYMREAMNLVLRWAFTDLHLHRLEANIQPANTASIALVRRCGFELEGFSPRYLKIGGRWCDHERWAIRLEGWRARRRHGGCGPPGLSQ
jgi:ribosomal-protein-alanine N-acetyltransferase